MSCLVEIVLLLVATVVAGSSDHSTKEIGINKIRNQLTISSSSSSSSIICRIISVHVLEDESTYYNQTSRSSSSIQQRYTDHTACIPIFDHDGMESDYTFRIELPDSITDAYKTEIASGELYVSIDGAIIHRDFVHIENESNVTVIQKEIENQRHRHLSYPTGFTTGTWTLAIVRISTSDSSPPDSLQALYDAHFVNTPNFMTQTFGCSHGALNWQPATPGKYQVTIDRPISSFGSASDLITEAQIKLRETYGLAHVYDIADRVAFVVPQGTGTWFAAASLNHWRVQLNYNWGKSLSAMIHELGHTMGLYHSNFNGYAYADKSGYMGFSYATAGTPLRCFNGNKNHIMGWFTSKTKTITSDGGWKIQLATFVDYPDAKSHQPVLINVKDKLFIQYNRAKGPNIDTAKEVIDMVTVTRDDGNGSSRLAAIAKGEIYEVSNFDGSGANLRLEVCNEALNTPADLMIISLGVNNAQSQCASGGGGGGSDGAGSAGSVCDTSGLKLKLRNASKNTVLGNLGKKYDACKHLGDELTIQAVVPQCTEKVTFKLIDPDGKDFVFTDTTSPFLLNGSTKRGVPKLTKPGTYKLTYKANPGKKQSVKFRVECNTVV